MEGLQSLAPTPTQLLEVSSKTMIGVEAELCRIVALREQDWAPLAFTACHYKSLFFNTNLVNFPQDI